MTAGSHADERDRKIMDKKITIIGIEWSQNRAQMKHGSIRTKSDRKIKDKKITGPAIGTSNLTQIRTLECNNWSQSGLIHLL
jgi:hypothetical protein